MRADPFYAEGLRFACTRCSICCRGEPGYAFFLKRIFGGYFGASALISRGFFVSIVLW